ncbi:hypothetical protein DL766_001876 [Monosporascus sp. MC13-8B]|nr:hypothetical protein DL763_009760 [Monosporascus cannonballus]RYP36636.1 hypothetical protein DL766_001876 [Monosporascus sp. MC13-8B]
MAPTKSILTQVFPPKPGFTKKDFTNLRSKTARSEPPSAVRVVRVASSASELFAEENIGLSPENIDKPRSGNGCYWISRVGNRAHGAEYSRRRKADDVVGVPPEPGELAVGPLPRPGLRV